MFGKDWVKKKKRYLGKENIIFEWNCKSIKTDVAVIISTLAKLTKVQFID